MHLFIWGTCKPFTRSDVEDIHRQCHDRLHIAERPDTAALEIPMCYQCLIGKPPKGDCVWKNGSDQCVEKISALLSGSQHPQPAICPECNSRMFWEMVRGMFQCPKCDMAL